MPRKKIARYSRRKRKTMRKYKKSFSKKSFKKSFRSRKLKSPHLKMMRIPARNPFGDKAFVKFDMFSDGPFGIANGKTVGFSVIQWNNMNSLLNTFYPSGSSYYSPPPGIHLYANVYQKYRISAIKLSATFILEGGSTTGATVPGQSYNIVYTPMISLAFEGYPSFGAASYVGNINSIQYWTSRAIQQQRWKVCKVMSQSASRGDKSTVSKYMTAKALWPDHVTLLEGNQSTVIPYTTSPAPPTGPPIPTYGVPTDVCLFAGWSVINLNDLPNPTTVSTIFTLRVKARVYVEYWDKWTNATISGYAI